MAGTNSIVAQGGRRTTVIPRPGITAVAVALLVSAAVAQAAEVGRGEVFAPIEIDFRGPAQRATDAPARDITFQVTFRHESGRQEYTVHGFWDGDGRGGTAGSVFKVRFCPTAPGRWGLVKAQSSAPALHGQREGDHITATPSRLHGFWEPGPDSPDGRWYRRSDGHHSYIIGNTQYSFLSGYQKGGPVPGHDIAADVAANARYFKKLRFALAGDRYPHPAEKPFLDAAGKPTDAGDCSHRPNPRWFRQRVDVAVRAAFNHDLIADLILCGPDTEDSRATLRAKDNKGDPAPFLKYIAARYGSYPNVWLCLCNEYDIKKPRYSATEIARFGTTIRKFLPYPTPLSVHASQYPDGKPEGKPAPAWSAKFDALPPWHDHQVLQRKLRALAPSADVIRLTAGNPDGAGRRKKPTVNDELSYQGEGDGHTPSDTLAAHLGAFLGGGYGSTGYKAGNKLGAYFWGGLSPTEHTAAVGLKFFREMIDSNVTFWKMAPDTSAFPGLGPSFRALAWPGHEYALGTDRAAKGIVARLPPGTWSVKRYDLITQKTMEITDSASGRFVFDAPDSRAALFHFKKNFEWQAATPESQGMSSARLDALRDDLAKRKTKAFLVVRNGRIVYEWYAPGHGRDKRHGTASLAKALVAGLSLAVAITDGKISLDDAAARFVPQWKDHPRKGKITVRQLGSHTSGLDDAEADGLPHEKLTGWKGDFWKRRAEPEGPFTIARGSVPAVFEPGKRLQYSNPGIGMLTYCVTAAMKGSPHKDIRALLRERVMRPIGVKDAEWSIGYGQVFTVDGLPLVASWGGGNYTARAAARLGLLVLREGDWEGRQLLSREAVRLVTTSAGLPGDCGMGWWTNAAGRYKGLPRDAAWGAGAGDQVLLVVPSLNLIMVRNGATLEAPQRAKNRRTCSPPTTTRGPVFCPSHWSPRSPGRHRLIHQAPSSPRSPGPRRRRSSVGQRGATTGRSPGETTATSTPRTATGRGSNRTSAES